MSNWVRRAGHYLLIGILFVSLGGHLGLLQTLAWGNMLVNFAREASWREAAEKTFDGEHPCGLCKVVKQSKQQEDKKPLLKAETKLDVTLPVAVTLETPAGIPVVAQVPGYFGRDAQVPLTVLLRPPKVG